MTYSNGYITVPESGIYFIYFNLYTDVLSSRHQQPAIYVDLLRIGFSMFYDPGKAERKSHFLGMLWNVKKGNQLSVRAGGGGSSQYYFDSYYSCFGAWKVN